MTPPDAASRVPLDEKRFRAISAGDYKSLDDKTKQDLVTARHHGIIRSSYELIIKQLEEVTARHPDRPIESWMAMLLHRDDPIAVEPLGEGMSSFADLLRKNALEVWVQVVDRATFAEGLRIRPGATAEERPYMEAAVALAATPPPGRFFVAVFSEGRCTITMFDPEPVDAAPGG